MRLPGGGVERAFLVRQAPDHFDGKARNGRHNGRSGRRARGCGRRRGAAVNVGDGVDGAHSGRLGGSRGQRPGHRSASDRHRRQPRWTGCWRRSGRGARPRPGNKRQGLRQLGRVLLSRISAWASSASVASAFRRRFGDDLGRHGLHLRADVDAARGAGRKAE